jgi:hypothetical protein
MGKRIGGRQAPASGPRVILSLCVTREAVEALNGIAAAFGESRGLALERLLRVLAPHRRRSARLMKIGRTFAACATRPE